MSGTDRYRAEYGGIVARAKAILTAPLPTWPIIAAEPATPASIYRGYVMILAAIPPMASLLHGVLFGYGAFGIVYRPSVMGALATAIVHYGLTLGGVYVLALIVNGLATSFDGTPNRVQALKLVAYASTASWLSGIFGLIPGLGFLGILGLYSLYLFYLGLPVLMQSPPAKTLPYTALIVVASIVVALVIAPLTAILIGMSLGSGAYSGGFTNVHGDIDGSVTLPNGGSLQLDKLQQAARAMETATQRAANGEAPARISPDVLKTFLPATLGGGLARTSMSSAGGQVAGIGGSTVEGQYGGNGRSVTLDVTDMGSIGALASLGGAMGITGDQETANSTSRMYQENGHTVAEEYDSGSHHGSYTLIAASRFMVKAEGSGISLAELKSIVKGVDLTRLGGLAR